jgi:hypothetical protein
LTSGTARGQFICVHGKVYRRTFPECCKRSLTGRTLRRGDPAGDPAWELGKWSGIGNGRSRAVLVLVLSNLIDRFDSSERRGCATQPSAVTARHFSVPSTQDRETTSLYCQPSLQKNGDRRRAPSPPTHRAASQPPRPVASNRQRSFQSVLDSESPFCQQVQRTEGWELRVVSIVHSFRSLRPLITQSFFLFILVLVPIVPCGVSEEIGYFATSPTSLLSIHSLCPLQVAPLVALVHWLSDTSYTLCNACTLHT